MKIKHWCPDCHTVWQVKEADSIDRVGSGTLTLACPACHEKRRERLRAKAAIVVGDPLPPIQPHPYSDVPKWLIRHDCGRRVVRKSEPMAG